MMKSLRNKPQQLHPFRSIALSRKLSETAVADEYCAKITCFTSSSKSNISITDQITRACRLINVPFTLKELEIALASCNTKSSPGPDGVAYCALTHLGERARCLLLDFYNKSWDSGTIPNEWKVARVLPILKPGKSPLDINSYRPIALSSCIGKIMEKNGAYADRMGP